MKTPIIALVALVVIGISAWLAFMIVGRDATPPTPSSDVVAEIPTLPAPTTETPIASPVPDAPKTETILGTSVGGRAITAYHFGEGEREILFVGGVHGAYSWNTALVAYQLMDYLRKTPTVIPENVRITVVPVMNPDGLSKVVDPSGPFATSDIKATTEQTIPGRFNGNNVDLNRNFDCEWRTIGTWQNRSVSGGNAPFSEPESQAMRDYVLANKPVAAVVWYSAAGGVFSSNCREGVLPQTAAMTELYAAASGYRPYEEFNFYEITGDMVNWFAKERIPAISVLLTTHTDTEWMKNKAGIDALLAHIAK